VVSRVPDHGIEINDCIKLSTCPDPIVDAQSRDLPCWVRISLDGAVRRAKRRDSGTKDRNAESVNPSDDLLKSLNEAVSDDLLCRDSSGLDADVVHTLEYHGVLDARLGEDVAVDAAKCIGSVAICEDAIATGGLVCDGDV